MKSMRVVVLRRNSALRESQFLKYENVVVRKPGTEKLCQLSIASLDVYTYARKALRV